MAMSTKMGRAIAGPLLILNLIMYVIVLGLSGWMLNRAITRGSFAGNAATPFLALISLLAGMVGIAAIITGLHHLKEWRGHSGAAAQATSWIAWLLLVLAFCLAWKQIHIGGRSIRHRVLEAFIIILTLTKLLYTLSLYLGGHRNEHALPTTTTTGTPVVDNKHHHHQHNHGGTVPPSNNPMAAAAV
ncbi:hypothetical protein MPTK1_3g04480 [Marchantia polymorpha subsp. ruderalis]|uniref:Uncharacterized protein n=2 Tax=Marchantia polymorpha TaxID=3197 RepID=A0AAF6AXE1_MARPO|nr:hypothetical protein MARPO_0022s0083 [Marchantia polymorpha]BBN04425.1 hypothetical protein Mp_3g04480 [Marchantia polymorpha subsp. ruderalis]|eukprot:PTQ43979.1 hypothetical protein MARPO_0022s0083 [Marchantia polymorpha]